MEQVFFNVPLAKLKPIFKEWVKEAQQEALMLNKAESQPEIERPVLVDGAMTITGLSRPTIYLKCQKNEIPHSKKNGRLYFFPSQIIKWLKEGKQKTTKEIEAETDAFLSSKKKGARNG